MLAGYIRRSAALAVTVVLGFGIVAGVADPAAAEPLIVCQGTETATYSPAITFLPQTVTVHVSHDLPVCLGAVEEGFAEETLGQQTISCFLPNIPVVEPDVIDYHWDNEQDSEVTFTLTTVEHLAGQTVVTAVGTVTDGFHEGAPAVSEIVLPDLNLLQCLQGVHQQHGLLTLIIG